MGGSVDSEVSITDINFRYGYSFFDFENDGFRLGPAIAVNYIDIFGDLPSDWSSESRGLSDLRSDMNGVAASQWAICLRSDAH